jgi:hypothetical protein
MKQKTSYRMGVGVSSLLLVLVVISMTTLSVLALLSASSDVKLSEKRQSYVLALAEVDCKLEEMMYELNEGKRPEELATEEIQMKNTSGDKWTISIPFYNHMQVTAKIEITGEGITREHYEISNMAEWAPVDGWNLIF